LVKIMADFFQGKLLEQKVSSFNGQIKVFRFLKRVRIEVNDLIQSGGLLENIWQIGIGQILKEKKNIKKVLILGLGGGTAAGIINKRIKKAKITGVEIDAVMIGLGKKYFGLGKIKELEILNQDAIKLVNDKGLKDKFDLILVDLYIGDSYPLKAEDLKFLKNLKTLVLKKDLIVFNRLFYNHHKKEAEEFVKKLEKLYDRIKLRRAYSNLLIFCY
jgi:spermidine synthase